MAASLRWLLPVWLVAAFAVAHLPVASETHPRVTSVALVDDRFLQLPAYKGLATGEIIEEHRGGLPDLALSSGDSVDDVVSAAVSATPGSASAGGFSAVLWHLAADASSFDSRAPPHLS